MGIFLTWNVFANFSEVTPSTNDSPGGKYLYWLISGLKTEPNNQKIELNNGTNHIVLGTKSISTPEGIDILTSNNNKVGIGTDTPRENLEILQMNPIVSIFKENNPSITFKENDGSSSSISFNNEILSIGGVMNIHSTYANIAPGYEVEYTANGEIKSPVVVPDTGIQSCNTEEIAIGFDNNGNIICEKIYCLVGPDDKTPKGKFQVYPQDREENFLYNFPLYDGANFPTYPNYFYTGRINNCTFKKTTNLPMGTYSDSSLPRKNSADINNDSYYYNFAKFTSS